jgi:hypothetical protein
MRLLVHVARAFEDGAPSGRARALRVGCWSARTLLHVDAHAIPMPKSHKDPPIRLLPRGIRPQGARVLMGSERTRLAGSQS